MNMKNPSDFPSLPPWPTHNQLHEEWMKDPEFRREFEALQPEFELARQIIDARIQMKLSQTEIAERIGTKQAAISRIENFTANPSLAFLKRLASALDRTLEIRFVEKKV